MIFTFFGRNLSDRTFQNGFNEVCGICSSKVIVQPLFHSEILKYYITANVSKIKKKAQGSITFIFNGLPENMINFATIEKYC